ncbi:hypothetical protein O5558_20655 [Escherichia coli]|nr:hypothetical protein [Escherichia coli]
MAKRQVLLRDNIFWLHRRTTPSAAISLINSLYYSVADFTVRDYAGVA